MRRLALPLALSLLAHAGLAALVWLCPAARPRPVGGHRNRRASAAAEPRRAG
ncbi:MAG: hypothetical protein U0797_24600 [Gemmataceae bacterium]